MSPAGPRATRKEPRGGEPQAGEPRGGQDEELWAAVAEPSRRLLLDVLLAQGEATPTTLAAELPFTRQAVSKHLAVLTRAGLVEGRRDGREVRYAVRPDRLDAAAQVMARVAERWDMRLQAIKRLAETAARPAAPDPPPSAPPAGR
jgi:ArsR family transcriptional regulator, cadmium/lead-responsive transcriptional repressor